MRLFLFYFVLLVAQGFLSALFGTVPAPDLYLLAVLTLLGRLRPWQLVLTGYGVGLLQDIIGHGAIGIHAFSLAGAAFVAAFLRFQLSQNGFIERMLIVTASLAGKWLVLSALLIWIGGGFALLGEVVQVAPLESLLTLLLSIWILPWANAVINRTTLLRRELL